MNRKLKRLLAMVLAVCIVIAPLQSFHVYAADPPAVTASQDGWVSKGSTWYYMINGKYATGWLKVGSKWYYFSASGVMQKNWQKIDGKWYYLGSNGVMRTDWQKIDGVWYYFVRGGAMATGWQKIDNVWYYFAPGGAMQTGWKKIDNVWYYFAPGGGMQTGWKKIDGVWYYFASGGAMQTGWKKIDGKWYYFESSGAMLTGWLKDGGYWYYFKSSGVMAANEVVNGYTFDSAGHWIKDVAISAAVTADNVLALLDAYDPDGAYIIRNTDPEGALWWLSGDTIGDACEDLGTAVHEQCHEYTSYSPDYVYNSITGRYMPTEERIYLGGGKSIQVAFTEVFDSSEMVDDIPEELRGNRFDTYVNTDEWMMASRQHGIYGLFNEFTAYCWGMNTNNCLYPYKDANDILSFWIIDEYISYVEFRYYMLKYLLYAEENYPAVYNGIIANKSFRTAFTKIDTKFKSVVSLDRSRAPYTSEDWETTYNALVAEMAKKEYTDLVELLKP